MCKAKGKFRNPLIYYARNKYSQDRSCAATIPAVSDLNIPLIDLPILLQENRWAERGIYRSLTDT
jgi:hypothetical protein